MIRRDAKETALRLARGFPILAITGPRQSGKTTLARTLFTDRAYVSLEDPDQREQAQTDPRGFLTRFADGAVIDEVGRSPRGGMLGLLSSAQPCVSLAPLVQGGCIRVVRTGHSSTTRPQQPWVRSAMPPKAGRRGSRPGLQGLSRPQAL